MDNAYISLVKGDSHLLEISVSSIKDGKDDVT